MQDDKKEKPKDEKKKWIPFLKEYCSNIEYVLKFLGKIKKALSFQCLIYIINYLFFISSF